MKIPEPTAADRDRFTALVPDAPGVDVKPMFGNLGAFVDGHMFMGLYGADVGVMLPEAERALLSEPGAGPFGPKGRPMGGYVTLPADWSARGAKRFIDTALTDAAARAPEPAKRRTFRS